MPTRSHNPLQGLRLLLVEDEAVLAFALSDALEDCGCEIVGPVGRLAAAVEAAATAALDGAILDVNLVNGEKVFPVADLLASRGIPFVFATGYGSAGLRDVDRTCPVLQKPFRLNDLFELVAAWRR